MAEDIDTGGPAAEILGDVAKVNGGQIALSARNEGDGTWSVRLGPGGPILMDDLPMEKALGIVGAPTGPYEAATQREQDLADLRQACEAAAREHANAEALKSDQDAGLVDSQGKRKFPVEPDAVRVGPAAGARSGGVNTTNARTRNGEGGPVNASDGDGLTKAEIIADLEGMGVEFDPRDLKADLLALRDQARAARAAG